MFRWPARVKLGWCTYCNVPLIQDECGKCGSKAVEVKINPPADARPAFDGDIELIKEALRNEFNDDSLANVLGIKQGGLILLNKVPHYDDMKEVLVDGKVVGRYFFDPVDLRWRWRLSRYSADVALEMGLIRSVIVDRVKPLTVLGDSSEPDGTQYAVVNREGDVLGIAIVRNGRLRVQSIFGRTPISVETSNKTATLEDFIKANDLKLRTLISRGIKHIYVMNSKVGLPVTVSFSGGKDSLVALDLTIRSGLEPKVIFNDTGLELPETLRNVACVVDFYGLELIKASPKRSFWEAVGVFGPPAKDFRWCCKVLKLIPLAETYRKEFPEGALNIIGQRGFESLDRALSGKVWRNRWIPHVLNVTPIQEWPQLAIWSYILINKLPFNELYFKGFDRLGCYLCPAANIAEYYMIDRTYPELWCAWRNYLIRLSTSLNMPAEWVRYSLWRWLNPLASGRVRVEKRIKVTTSKHMWINEYELRLGLRIIERELSLNHAKIVLDKEIPMDAIKSQLGILRDASLSNDEEGVELTSDSYTIKLSYNLIEVHVRDVSKHNALDVLAFILKILFRWIKCVSCSACTLWCPSGAISVINGKPLIDGRKCTGCKICLEVCPVSEVLVNKLAMSLVINDPKGIKRSKFSRALALSKAMRRTVIDRLGNNRSQYEYHIDEVQVDRLFKV